MKSCLVIASYRRKVAASWHFSAWVYLPGHWMRWKPGRLCKKRRGALSFFCILCLLLQSARATLLKQKFGDGFHCVAWHILARLRRPTYRWLTHLTLKKLKRARHHAFTCFLIPLARFWSEEAQYQRDFLTTITWIWDWTCYILLRRMFYYASLCMIL